ncbi:MAG: radical SAM protein [Nitrospirota bacterium]|nr:radical SAM protein [Nitrospirota bacterium]
MTEKCNLSCKFCYAFKGRDDPSIEQLLSVGKSLSSQGITKVNLMGGEPFLQRSIFTLIDFFHSCFNISITTNGTLPTKNNINFLSGKIERLTISLDTLSSSTACIIRGENYDLKNTIQNILTASDIGIPLKINTVITKHNLSELDNIGRFLNSINGSVFWKIFELTDNPNVNSDISHLKVPVTIIDEEFIKLKNRYPSLPIDIAYCSELNSNYIIMRSNGDIHIPKFNNYQCLGNICDESLSNILNRVEFCFEENKQIYIARQPEF